MANTYSGKEQKRRAELLLTLYIEQQGICAYCREPMHFGPHNAKQASYEHMTPKCRGGSTTYANGIATCRACNNLKSILNHAEMIAAIRAFGSVAAMRKAFKVAQMHCNVIKQRQRQRVLQIMQPWRFEPGFVNEYAARREAAGA